MNNTQVCHNFAHLSPTGQKGSNLFYDIHDNVTATLYSYGRHFAVAHIVKYGTAFVTYASYSNTTAKHRSHALSALSHFQLIHVPFEVGRYFINGEKRNDIGKTITETLKVYETEFQTYKRKELNALKRSYANEIERTMRKAHAFCRFFDCFDELTGELKRLSDKYGNTPISSESANRVALILPMSFLYRDIFTPSERERIATKAERAKASEAKREQREAERIAESVDKFRKGEARNVYGSRYTYLRYNEQAHALETSKGMSVPIDTTLKALYRVMRTGEALTQAVSVKGFNVDHISADMIRIGCHTISREEADRFAHVLT